MTKTVKKMKNLLCFNVSSKYHYISPTCATTRVSKEAKKGCRSKAEKKEAELWSVAKKEKEVEVWLLLTQVRRISSRRLCILVLERQIGQGSWSWYSSIEVSIRRRIRLGFPLKWERFWPWIITYILCLLSLYCLCFGSYLMKKNTMII